MNQLLTLEDIIIQKADKGNVTVLLDKSTYIEKMESILADISKFTPTSFEGECDDLKYIPEKVQEINKLLSKLVDSGVITPVEQKNMCPKGSAPVVPVGDIPPLRPILSAIDTLSYNLAKDLVPVLSPLTLYNYVTKDSFTFAADVRKQNSKYIMTSSWIRF